MFLFFKLIKRFAYFSELRREANKGIDSAPKRSLSRASTSSEQSSGSKSNLALSRPPGSVPQSSRPMSARNLKATLKKEATVKESSASSRYKQINKQITSVSKWKIVKKYPILKFIFSTASSVEDDVLQNVKFKTETLSKMQAKKQELTEAAAANSATSKPVSEVRRNSASQPAGLTAFIGSTISKDTLTAQITESVKAKHDEEIRELKEQFAKEKKNFEDDKKHQEKMLRDMFKAEMDAMKSKLENDFSTQKKTMIREFNDKLEKDKLEMKAAHEKEISVKEEFLKKEIETLKKEFDLKKRELEAELKAQFSKDISQLREELERAREVSNNHINHKDEESESIEEVVHVVPKRAKSKSKQKSKHSPAVLKEIQGLESDIEKLRSQVEKSSRIVIESDDDDSIDEDYVPAFESRVQRVHHHPHLPMHHYEQQFHPNGKFT